MLVKAREGFASTVASMAADHPGWLDWDTEMATAEPAAPVDVKATDPLYILYTSGTTGAPKGVVRDNGGHAVALNWTMENIYDVGPGDVMWTASDVGWVVGHSYIVYGPLLAGATTVLYEGKPVGTPDAGAFWRVIQDHKVNVLFTAPTALRAIRKADPEAKLLDKYDISSLRTLFAAGERLDTDTFHWASRVLGVPVVDHWWQTETGWAICANPRGLDGLPIKAGSPSVPMPGFRLNIVDGAGEDVEAGTEGNIVLAPAAAARHPDDALAQRRTLHFLLPPGVRRATTPPATPATGTRTATSSSWAAPTTSSTSPDTGSPPAPWNR